MTKLPLRRIRQRSVTQTFPRSPSQPGALYLLLPELLAELEETAHGAVEQGFLEQLAAWAKRERGKEGGSWFGVEKRSKAMYLPGTFRRGEGGCGRAWKVPFEKCLLETGTRLQYGHADHRGCGGF